MARAHPRTRVQALVLVLLPLGLLLPACVEARPGATVVSVGDGDSLRVATGNTVTSVRLACIDAPEISQRPHGQRSRRHLQQRLPQGSGVTLESQGSDRYGRLVAEVSSEGGVNINLAMVADGQAFANRRYLSGCDREAYLAAEQQARQRGVGVWQVEGGITRPWEVRRRQRDGRG